MDFFFFLKQKNSVTSSDVIKLNHLIVTWYPCLATISRFSIQTTHNVSAETSSFPYRIYREILQTWRNARHITAHPRLNSLLAARSWCEHTRPSRFLFLLIPFWLSVSPQVATTSHLWSCDHRDLNPVSDACASQRRGANCGFQNDRSGVLVVTRVNRTNTTAPLWMIQFNQCQTQRGAAVRRWRVG